MKDKIKQWYQMGLWNKDMVLNALYKGILTDEDVAEILNQ